MTPSAQGTITEHDYVVAQNLHMRPRRIFAVLGILIVILWLLTAIVQKSLLMLGIVVGIACYFLILLPWQARRNYRSYRALSEPVAFEARPEGILTRSQTGEGLRPWDHFLMWRQSDKMLLVYLASNAFCVIPTHFFESSESRAAFVALLEEHLGQAA